MKTLIHEELGFEHLPMLSEFIIRISDATHHDVFHEVKKYTGFLQKKPELWMFVPCWEDGKPIKEPNSSDEYYSRGEAFCQSLFNEDCNTYNEAESRVLFEGFELSDFKYDCILKGYSHDVFTDSFCFDDLDYWVRVLIKAKTIEQMINEGFKLKLN